MALRLFNTLARTKEAFRPREAGRVTMYICGPTVYNYTHIGHLRPAVVADVLKRYLRRQGYAVFHVTNFTDVDDKIIARARDEGVDPTTLSQRYIDDYLENMRQLDVDNADLYVRVTDHMDDIVHLVEALIERGYAYVVEGDVYFSVDAKHDYGKLSGRSLNELQAGARVEVDRRKRHPMDFALWKAAKPGEPAWPSPWGPGRPGWHIECSALAMRYLGVELDVHGGGDDLIFPHHENEIAQSEAFSGTTFVRYWLHNGMVQLDDEKMSKSSGKFIALRDLVRRFPGGGIRLFLLTTHYRKPLNYSEEALDEAVSGWRRLETARRHLAGHTVVGGSARPEVGSRTGSDLERARLLAGDGPAQGTAAATLADLEAQVAACENAFTAAMDDDLNTAGALAALFDLVRVANTCLSRPDVPADSPQIRHAAAALDDLGATLGLWTVADAAQGPAAGDLVDGLLHLVLELRASARHARDWQTADAIRDRLQALGVVVEDTAQGSRWTLAGS